MSKRFNKNERREEPEGYDMGYYDRLETRRKEKRLRNALRSTNVQDILAISEEEEEDDWDEWDERDR